MIICTGNCALCGRCTQKGKDRGKAKMMVFPPDFSPDTGQKGKGIAVDTGTTTVAVTLWDLEEGKLLAGEAFSNPQARYGADVITRITFCGEESGNTELLQKMLTEEISRVASDMCRRTGCKVTDIVKAAVCGNTTMSHIFAGYDPSGLARAPFEPAYTGSLLIPAHRSGLDISPEGTVYVVPCIAGHIGGDISAGLAACRHMLSGQLSLYIDLGTNGEIVLADGDHAFGCSTAAGPALEGASITWGMRAAPGAIEKVVIDGGDVRISVIDDQEPRGICGSGITDAVAQMLQSGLINRRGRLISGNDAPEGLGDRIIENGRSRAFVLAQTHDGRDILITQGDIRQIQLVKGAVEAGIRFLLERAGKRAEDIERVVVAGAFGNHIDAKSAVRTGLLPDTDPDRIFFAGNASGTGASMALASSREAEVTEKIPAHVEHVDLAAEKGFDKVFIDSMLFR